MLLLLHAITVVDKKWFQNKYTWFRETLRPLNECPEMLDCSVTTGVGEWNSYPTAFDT